MVAVRPLMLMSRETFQIFLLGAVAKFGATIVTYPLLVVKVIAYVSGFSVLSYIYTVSAWGPLNPHS